MVSFYIEKDTAAKKFFAAIFNTFISYTTYKFILNSTILT